MPSKFASLSNAEAGCNPPLHFIFYTYTPSVPEVARFVPTLARSCYLGTRCLTKDLSINDRELSGSKACIFAILKATSRI